MEEEARRGREREEKKLQNHRIQKMMHSSPPNSQLHPCAIFHIFLSLLALLTPRAPRLPRAPPALLSRCFTAPLFLLSQPMNSRATIGKSSPRLPLQAAPYQRFLSSVFICTSLFDLKFFFVSFVSNYLLLLSMF